MKTPSAPDSFEQRLAAVPRRGAPADWRAGILDAAAAATPDPARVRPRPTEASWLWTLLARPWSAWLGFAAVWALVFATSDFDAWLNGRPEPATRSLAASRANPEELRRYREEILRVAELLPDADRPSRPHPGPVPPEPRPTEGPGSNARPGPRSSLDPLPWGATPAAPVSAVA